VRVTGGEESGQEAEREAERERQRERGGSPLEVHGILGRVSGVVSFHLSDFFDEEPRLGARLREQNFVGESRRRVRRREHWRQVGRGREEVVLRLEAGLESLEQIPIEPRLAEPARVSLRGSGEQGELNRPSHVGSQDSRGGRMGRRADGTEERSPEGGSEGGREREGGERETERDRRGKAHQHHKLQSATITLRSAAFDCGVDEGVDLTIRRLRAERA
jgi:hypothetical protein